MKKILLFLILLIPLNAFSKGQTDKNLNSTEESIELQENIEIVKKGFEKISEFNENICLLWFYEHKISNELAIPVCKCEKEKINRTLSLEDVLYFQNNIEQWNLLMYKEDEHSIRINKMLIDIRRECLENLENPL